MAVVQISRIQLRRGRAIDTPIPQLASGELAWAIDTQELWIGSGSVGEGSPAVKNIQVLTEANNLLDYGTYIYTDDTAPIQTGTDANFPVVRSLQDKLDDQVSSADYGIKDNLDPVQTVGQRTAAIQRAVDNLFLDTYATPDPLNPLNFDVKRRITLVFAPGEYTFNTTIYLPSYVSIQGAGKEKTKFTYTGTGTAFEFVNDTSTKTLRSTLGSTTYNNQPKFCTLAGFTLTATATSAIGIKMNAVRDSIIEDIRVVGNYPTATSSNAVAMYAVSSVVTCQRNRLINVSASAVKHGVYAEQDIFNNYFSACEFLNSQYGINFGNFVMATLPTNRPSAYQYGPRKNLIENCYFDTIDNEGVIITNGTGNKTRGNTFVNVGNEGAGNDNSVYSQIKFVPVGNTSVQDNFDRAVDIYYDINGSLIDKSLSYNLTADYVPEIAGKANWSDLSPKTLALIYTPTPSYTNLFRIPFTRSCGIEVTYILENSTNTQMRRGKLTVAVDIGTSALQIVDDYDYTGSSTEDTRIDFDASIINGCVVFKYHNDNTLDTTIAPSTLTYTYSVIS
jgi:hypothetical protein